MTPPADGANWTVLGDPLVEARVLDLTRDGAAYGPKLRAAGAVWAKQAYEMSGVAAAYRREIEARMMPP